MVEPFVPDSAVREAVTLLGGGSSDLRPVALVGAQYFARLAAVVLQGLGSTRGSCSAQISRKPLILPAWKGTASMPSPGRRLPLRPKVRHDFT